MHLEIALDRDRVSTFDSPRVHVRLTNSGPAARVVPGPNDQTDALRFEFYAPDGRLVRRASGLTLQRLMSRSRLDPRPDLDRLDAGATWAWTVDLTEYHYPLAEGRYEVQAAYRDLEGGEIRSARHALTVEAESLRGVAMVRDNPVLDGLALLLETERDGQRRVYLRQHGTNRPLAAWYCASVELDGSLPHASLATNNFFTTDSFDPFFRKWLVWTQGDHVHARVFMWGAPSEPPRRAPLPAGMQRLSSVIVTEADELLVFFWDGQGQIDCAALEPDRLEPRFSIDVPPSRLPPVIRGDCDHIHVALAVRGLAYLRLEYDGHIRNYRQLFETRRTPVSIEIEPVHKFGQATFVDRPGGDAMTLVVARPQYREVQRLERRVGVRGDLREFSWAYEPGGGSFHQLSSTSRGDLYYAVDEGSPQRIARGPGPFFPRVTVQGAVHLGFYRPTEGFRFFEYSRRRFGPHLQRYEVEP